MKYYIPVATLTWATPWLSRRTTPICDGVAPFRASLQIWSTIWSGEVLNHAGGVREYGMAEAEIPFPLEWRRPIWKYYVGKNFDSRLSFVNCGCGCIVDEVEVTGELVVVETKSWSWIWMGWLNEGNQFFGIWSQKWLDLSSIKTILRVSTLPWILIFVGSNIQT